MRCKASLQHPPKMPRSRGRPRSPRRGYRPLARRRSRTPSWCARGATPVTSPLAGGCLCMLGLVVLRGGVGGLCGLFFIVLAHPVGRRLAESPAWLTAAREVLDCFAEGGLSELRRLASQTGLSAEELLCRLLREVRVYDEPRGHARPRVREAGTCPNWRRAARARRGRGGGAGRLTRPRYGGLRRVSQATSPR